MNLYIEKKRNERRIAKLKIRLVWCCIYAILGGMILGFFIGRVLAYGEEVPIVETVETAIEEAEIVEEVRYYDCPLDYELQDYIRLLCEESDVPMDLVIAQIQIESGYRADCISGTNDYGLMQINKINHKWLKERYGVSNFLNPYDNVLCGVSILAEHLKEFGDTDKALMAYNMGRSGADNLWRRGIYTTAYVEKVKKAMTEIKTVNYKSSKNLKQRKEVLKNDTRIEDIS